MYSILYRMIYSLGHLYQTSLKNLFEKIFKEILSNISLSLVISYFPFYDTSQRHFSVPSESLVDTDSYFNH